MDNKLKNSFMNTSIRNIDVENHEITHTINSKALDRYDSIVLPKGADVKHFMNNAVVLWAHNGDLSENSIPIAKCTELKIEEDAIIVKTKFNVNDELAMKVFNSYKDGFLNAWSIGFIPLSYKKFDKENYKDLNSKYNLKVTPEQIANAYWGVYLVYEWELLEYSAVPVPGNPEALSVDETDSYKRELITRGLTGEGISGVNFRDLVKRDEEGEPRVEPKEDANSESVSKKEPVAENEEKPAEEVVEVKEVDSENKEDVVKEVKSEVEAEVPKDEAKVEVESEAQPEVEVKAEDAVETKPEEESEVVKDEVKEVNPEDTKDPKAEVPEVSKESAEEAQAMVDAAQAEVEKAKKAEDSAREIKIEELSQAVKTLTDSLDVINTINKSIVQLSEKISKLEAKSSEVDSMKKDFESIVKEAGSDNLDAIRQIESEKDIKPEDPTRGFWSSILTK